MSISGDLVFYTSFDGDGMLLYPIKGEHVALLVASADCDLPFCPASSPG